MLIYFLTSEAGLIKTNEMFDCFKIAKVLGDSYLEEQGKYPVIFVTLKNIKAITDYEIFIEKMREIISELYDEYSFLENSDKITKSEKEKFIELRNFSASEERLSRSLYLLIQLLYKHFAQKIYTLIDDYDMSPNDKVFLSQ